MSPMAGYGLLQASAESLEEGAVVGIGRRLGVLKMEKLVCVVGSLWCVL